MQAIDWLHQEIKMTSEIVKWAKPVRQGWLDVPARK